MEIAMLVTEFLEYVSTHPATRDLGASLAEVLVLPHRPNAVSARAHAYDSAKSPQAEVSFSEADPARSGYRAETCLAARRGAP